MHHMPDHCGQVRKGAGGRRRKGRRTGRERRRRRRRPPAAGTRGAECRTPRGKGERMRQFKFRTLPKCIAGIFGEVSHFACNSPKLQSGVEVGARLWYTALKCFPHLGERARPGSSLLSWRRRLRSLQHCKGAFSVFALLGTATTPTSVRLKRNPPSFRRTRRARRCQQPSAAGSASCPRHATTCA